MMADLSKRFPRTDTSWKVWILSEENTVEHDRILFALVRKGENTRFLRSGFYEGQTLSPSDPTGYETAQRILVPLYYFQQYVDRGQLKQYEARPFLKQQANSTIINGKRIPFPKLPALCLSLQQLRQLAVRAPTMRMDT